MTAKENMRIARKRLAAYDAKHGVWDPVRHRYVKLDKR